MDIRADISFKTLTTMKLGGPAAVFAEVRTPQEVQAVYKDATKRGLSVLVIGGGSNLIAHDEGFGGLVIRMRIPGFEIIADDLLSTTIKIGAGENWDSVVKRSVEQNLSGIEALSSIPGSSGAAPVQNIGAYGQDISGTLASLEAYDTTTDQFVTLSAGDCQFGYRSSIFRTTDIGRYIITSITLKLSKSAMTPPFYESLQKYLDDHSITIFTPAAIRQAVAAIRADKLPDPAVKASAGSFFQNAVVDNRVIDSLKQQYPDLKSYPMADGRSKIYSGWLIETAGFKGQLLHGIRVHDKNCLVLVNEAAASYADLAAARDEIIGKVRDLFRIELVQEPLEIPAATKSL